MPSPQLRLLPEALSVAFENGNKSQVFELLMSEDLPRENALALAVHMFELMSADAQTSFSNYLDSQRS